MGARSVKGKLAEESVFTLEEQVKNTISERLGELGLTYGGLATKVGMTRQNLKTVLDYGRGQGISMTMLERLLNGLDLEVKFVPKPRK